MAGYMMFCSVCKDEKKEPFYGFYPFMTEDAICQEHNCKMQKLPISCDDYFIISRISREVPFLESMIALKESDSIEYQLKMSQFKANLAQQESVKKQINENNSVTCPYCKSTNIHKISGTERAMSVMGLGIFSKKINKSFKCKNCGGTF